MRCGRRGARAMLAAVIALFALYVWVALILPAHCGWCEPGRGGICRYFAYPLRTLILSEFVAVEFVGICLIVAGVLYYAF